MIFGGMNPRAPPFATVLEMKRSSWALWVAKVSFSIKAQLFSTPMSMDGRANTHGISSRNWKNI